MDCTCIFYQNYYCEADVIINQGGTSSGKTYAIMQVLLMRAIKEPGARITVAGQDIPNLRDGSMMDTETIIESAPFIKHRIKAFNRTEKKYIFKNGSWLQFKSYDGEQDAKNGKRDYLFINEANGISYEIYEQLAVRTKKQVFIDYNPSAKFWAHHKLFPLINDPDAPIEIVRFISNYTHNDFLPETIKRRIESRADDKEWFRVYGQGYTGKVKNLIFSKWQQAFKMPDDANNFAYGLDWGWAESKCAVVACSMYDGSLYAKELIYELHLSNEDLIKKLKRLQVGRTPIFCDSAEPKSIDELRRAGLNAIGIKKTSDDTEFSIKKINEFNAFNVIGLNFVKEVSSYAFKNGRMPKKDDHLCDASRYYILGTFGRVGSKFKIY